MAQETNIKSGEHEIISMSDQEVIDSLKEIVSAEAVFALIATTGEIAIRYNVDVQTVIYHADLKHFYSERLGKQRVVFIPSFESWFKRHFRVDVLDRKPFNR